MNKRLPSVMGVWLLSCLMAGCESDQQEQPPVSISENQDRLDPSPEEREQAMLEGEVDHVPGPDQQVDAISSTNGWRAYNQGIEDSYRMVLEGPDGFRREFQNAGTVSFSPAGTHFVFCGNGDAIYADGLLVLSLDTPTASPLQVTNRGVSFGTWDNHPPAYVPCPDTDQVTWPSATQMRWLAYTLNLDTMEVRREE